MKLYATSTSERASKGQGGNREIKIDLTIDDTIRASAGSVTLTRAETLTDSDMYRVMYQCPDEAESGGSSILFEQEIKKTKGKQKKDNDSDLTGGHCGKYPCTGAII